MNGQLFLIRADGESDNEYVATFKNEEANDESDDVIDAEFVESPK